MSTSFRSFRNARRAGRKSSLLLKKPISPELREYHDSSGICCQILTATFMKQHVITNYTTYEGCYDYRKLHPRKDILYTVADTLIQIPNPMEAPNSGLPTLKVCRRIPYPILSLELLPHSVQRYQSQPCTINKFSFFQSISQLVVFSHRVSRHPRAPMSDSAKTTIFLVLRTTLR